MKKIILVVDDNNTNLLLARDSLSEEYKVITLASAKKMFTFLEKIRPDLILLDIEMPEMDGIKALKILKADEKLKDIPVMFLTIMSDQAVEILGFQLGVVDFIAKPFSKLVLLNRIKTHLNVTSLVRQEALRKQAEKFKAQATEQFKKQAALFRRLNNAIIAVLANIIENRSTDETGHAERAASYAGLLLDAMLASELYDYAALIDEIGDIASFTSASCLHDVGKIVIPTEIVNKLGALTDDEFDKIKEHPLAGEKIIDQIIATSGSVPLLKNAKIIAGYHHERWDGTGYPYGLKGEDIPIQGRIMQIADVYDALISKRPYRDPFSHEQAIAIIMAAKGTQFDPKIAEVFFKTSEQFKAIGTENP
ncbi:MAG: response regulator [Turicibacter sp.]|nr:response regulator [Turicibacter sp.]